MSVAMVQLNDEFSSIDVARTAIKAHVLDEGESYKTIASDQKRFIIACKDTTCKFRIRATRSKKEVVSITIFEPHSCSPAVHYKSKQSQSVSYLLAHHRALIVDNCNITVAQIRSNERLQFGNNISYKQAYRTIQAVLLELHGDEASCFAKFPAYIERYEAADPHNFARLAIAKSGNFEAAFFAPGGLRSAHYNLRGFTALDGTHTKSRFRMMLLLAVGVDANDLVLPLAWALVPTENEHGGPGFVHIFIQHFRNFKTRTALQYPIERKA